MLKQERHVESFPNIRGYLYGILIFLFAPTVYAGVWDYLPSEAVRFKVDMDLRPLWDGRIDVNEVSLDPNGLFEIHDLSLADRGGRNWLKIESARANLAIDQNGLCVKELKLERPHVILWFDKTDLNFPLQIKFPEGAQKQHLHYLNIEKFIVEDAAITAASEGKQATWDGINIIARRTGKGPNYRVQASRKKLQSSIDANGFFNTESEIADIQFTGEHKLSSNESAVLLDIFGIPIVNDANADVSADLRFSGKFNDVGILWPVGEVAVRNGSLDTATSTMMRDFRARIVFPFSNIVLFQNMSANAFGGIFKGSAYIENIPGKNDYGVHLVFRNASLSEFSEIAGPYDFLSKGKGSATYDFTGRFGTLDGYKGRGVIFLDDANLWKMPGFAALFGFIGVKTLVYSDAVAAFDVNGPVITVKRANISSSLTGIEFLPGSTVNFKTKYIDGHVVFVPLETWRNFWLKVPVARTFVSITDQLGGVSIKGYLWQEPSTLIRKEPIADMQKVTLGFFRDAAKSGGQIGSDAFGKMEGLFGLGSSDKIEGQEKKRQTQ